MRKFVRRYWRIWTGRHPDYEWGACSKWSPWRSIVNRTIGQYIKDDSEEMRNEMAGWHPRRVHAMYGSKQNPMRECAQVRPLAQLITEPGAFLPVTRKRIETGAFLTKRGSQMLQELFKAICDKSVEAKSPNIIEYDPRKRYMFRDNAGEVSCFEPEMPPQRKHLAGSVDAMAAFADHHTLDATSSVWVNRFSAVLFPNDKDREDSVTLTLSFSKPMAALQEWEKNPAAGIFDQKNLIRLLRITFRNCLAEAGDIINIVKSIRWGESKGVEGTVGKGKSSLGKSIQQEFVGLDNLPDFVTFAVPVFAQGFISVQRVECALEPLEESCTFKLSPTFGQIEAAIVAAEKHLIEALITQLPGDIPVYHGQP